MALKYKGERLAEVWFKPEGEPLAVAFRIPEKSFEIAGMGQPLTVARLLNAIGIATEQVESWRHEGACHPATDLTNPLPPAPPQVAQVDILVRLKPPSEVSRNESSEPEVPLIQWQDLEARWKAILSMEAAMETLRISMEGLLTEMEGSLTKSMSVEEKIHALRADVAQWTKAKNHIRFALPKLRDYIHRATWAMGSPERKRLEAIYKDHIQPQIPFAQVHEVLRQLEDLQKDRQVLAGQGTSVYQSSRTIATACSTAFKTLQSNAAAAAHRKKREAGTKNRFFKDR
jgi:hypothetical protein